MSNFLEGAARRSERLMDALGAWLMVLQNKQYRGDNPAIASVYGPYRASIVVMSIIAAMIVIFGAIIPMDSAAVAKAHVVVLGNRKTVQHLEGGIVRKLLVREGDVVKLGQPLVEMSDVAPKANRSILQNQLYSEQVTEARLIALRDEKEKMVLPAELWAAVKTSPELDKMLREQSALFLTQRQSYLDKIKTLKLKIDQTREEIGGMESQVKSAGGQLAYIEDEIDSVSKLVSKGLAVKSRLLALQREKERLEGDRGQYVANISKAKQSINEIEVQLLNLKNDFNSQNGDALKESHAKLGDIQEKLRAAVDVVNRTIITSPSEGIVTGLKFHTIGGVIAPGTPIMDIIPQGEELILEARINPVDIDVVTAGLSARVVFSAYRSRAMPQLYGKVTSVSADSFSEQQGLQESSYYVARISVDPAQLNKLASQIRLYPGMPAEVYIRTGSRSFLGYLFAPITDSLHKAFKES